MTRKALIAGATALGLFVRSYLSAVADLTLRAGPPPWRPGFRELAKVPFAFKVVRRW